MKVLEMHVPFEQGQIAWLTPFASSIWETAKGVKVNPWNEAAFLPFWECRSTIVIQISLVMPLAFSQAQWVLNHVYCCSYVPSPMEGKGDTMRLSVGSPPVHFRNQHSGVSPLSKRLQCRLFRPILPFMKAHVWERKIKEWVKKKGLWVCRVMRHFLPPPMK